MKQRCPWVTDSALYRSYHDKEWGVPVHDDRLLFEFLVLEGAQAGLSWLTILQKRQHYRKVFDNFAPERVAAYDEQQCRRLLQDPGIIRNRRKIESAIRNAKAFLRVRAEYGSFDRYVWQFVEGKQVHNRWKSMDEVPVYSPVATEMSRDLKQRGFNFVGPTICYSFMQAVGMVNDHLTCCFRHPEICEKVTAGRSSG